VIVSALRGTAILTLALLVVLAVSSLPAPAAPAGPPIAPYAFVDASESVPEPMAPAGPNPVVAAPLPPPTRLLIPSLNVDARVEALGVDSSGALETPQNMWNVGWYRGGPSPGDPGDAVIDGHVGLPGSPLVFSHLARLAIGADVIAILADGTRSRFTVTDLRSWPARSSPTGLFAAGGQPRLSLITCTGSYDGASQSYADRLVVEARYAGTA